MSVGVDLNNTHPALLPLQNLAQEIGVGKKAQKEERKPLVCVLRWQMPSVDPVTLLSRLPLLRMESLLLVASHPMEALVLSSTLSGHGFLRKMHKMNCSSLAEPKSQKQRTSMMTGSGAATLVGRVFFQAIMEELSVRLRELDVLSIWLLISLRC